MIAVIFDDEMRCERFTSVLFQEDGVFGDWCLFAVDFGPYDDGVDTVTVLV